MTRFTTALATSALLVATAPTVFAQTTMEFDDVTVVQGYVGSEVFTSDGKLFGTLTAVEIDGSQAEIVLEPAVGVTTTSDPIYITADEGNVMISDDKMTLNGTEEELKLAITGGTGDERATILLVE